MRTTFILLIAIGIGFTPSRSLSNDGGLDAETIATIRQAHQAYVNAWLTNDPAAVMATLTEDAVLIPHHGVDPIVGADAIRQFWFPPGAPATTVTEMINTITEVQGHGELAIVWGRNELAFTYEGKTYRNEGNYLSVLTRDDEGRWRIARRIWNDPPPEVD
jgi:uncharacterized protein (TIGR02246 family)